MNRRWPKFVALGDSLTEGVGDVDETGRPRGWADRFAEEIARRQGGLRYANLAVRGLATAEVLSTQVPAAVALRPDLVSVIVGMNDLVRPNLSLRTVLRDYDSLLDEVGATGATVLTATLPDPGAILPLPPVVRSRFTARLGRFNDHLRGSAWRRRAHCLDLARLADGDHHAWSADRLHPSPYGHQVVADEFLALLTGIRSDRAEPLPADPPRALVGMAPSLRWLTTTAVPWLRRQLGAPASVPNRPKAPDYLALT
ncbi:SGNH/GDSL hydrolase family protein [Actinokineospora xionganensis]|uniref:SGNH/GDSL hydrolase family protein n=1 Tax=Actinokineospora xionganensis TaxID=2684470 RepID=A0ABR7L4M8_9PSEU|nr:SGNH/GDSL hydrolase family protein [Actinokineospora xionganensis]MBC6447640.1 SGNH/GDSL hydrolase family protein [Actinokineospora xionganensis]